jgi:hypothetical protein
LIPPDRERSGSNENWRSAEHSGPELDLKLKLKTVS